MVFGNIVPSYLGTLSLQQALELTNVYLENAYKMKDPRVALVLCHNAEVALSQAKKANKKYSTLHNAAKYQFLCQGVATAYIDLGAYLERQGHESEAISLCQKAEKWGGTSNGPGRFAQLSQPTSTVDTSIDTPPSAAEEQDNGFVCPPPAPKINQRPKVADVPEHIFAENVRPPSVEFKFPQPDERLNNTPQLACCLSLLKASHSRDHILDQAAQSWLRTTEKDSDEQERLHVLSIEVIRAFKRDEFKDAKAVAEVVWLAPVLSKDSFHDLLREFYSGIDHSGLLNFQLLEGLAQLIQGADTGYLGADDLVKILELLSTRLRDTHQQSVQHMYQLTLAVSHVLDAMADTKVMGLDRKTLHEPLSSYLNGLMKSTDPFLVYQAAYAFQALLCVPDNETTWQAAMRRTGKVVQGVAGLVSAVKGLDLNKFMEGLSNIQQGMDGVSKMVDVVKNTYEGVSSLAKSGQGLVQCLKDGLSFERRRDWYAALRGADTLIRDGDLVTFKKLVCVAPCRYDAAFQWGVCQRLGEMAANPTWDVVTRQSAIAFLGEIYRDDKMWGHQVNTKQWILNILMQLASTDSSSSTGGVMQLHTIAAGSLLHELQVHGDDKKQDLYQQSRANGPVAYPMKNSLPELASPSLLDRVQNRPDVEGNIRVLRKQRTKERENTVYIPPQAKANFQASDDARFPLMEKVKTFLDSEQKVFLLLGDSGAGKSTFSRELEFQLWQTYENKTGRIPLHINLPAIEKPEHDMIAKQLRKIEFTEPQIREMKHHRKFILICDGYDESQQTHNLYTTNKLNQHGEWDAQMVISCRSEYLGSDYRDRFQPGGDRNTRLDSLLFQEAVISPFTMDQVQAYIQQYVRIHQPLWRIEDYKQALDLIPSLKDLVKNPFLMTLSLDVLPRMVDPGQHLSTTRVTRVALYDHFVEQWLERGKKRLGEKDMSRQTKATFERLSAEGFTLNGIEYLKRLAVAIYKEQGGNPVVEYSQLVDERSWKDEFFEKESKQLLLEACPLTRNGNQHRFIHRSLLEYGLARAVFDPQDRKNRGSTDPVIVRRGSTSSNLSFEIEDTSTNEASTMDVGPDRNCPLVWRNFVSDHSLLQFLEERVHQEPLFKKKLLAYMELSKSDRIWRRAAANSITILNRSGVQFIGADLRGIQIPGADLSYGVFDSAQLQGADLRKVSFRGTWMRGMDLNGVQMEGAQFGELPYLSEDTAVKRCAFSSDGKFLALGLYSGTLTMYATSNWEKAMTLIGHTDGIMCVVFSPVGDKIASASADKTARIWDVTTGSCQQIIIHAKGVLCVAYSPSGNQIAIGTDDAALRVRDSVTGEDRRTFFGHTKGICRIVYSPDGYRIASSSKDYTVRMWNADTGDCTHIMIGHSDWIWGLAFSPRGNQLSTSSNDQKIRVWDVESGLCRHTLTGHGREVLGIAYSPQGDQLATGGYDSTVRIWDIETGVNRQIFTGHGNGVLGISYSPQGNHIASASLDATVRLWDVSAGLSRFVPNDHDTGMFITFSVKCSPSGDQFASYGTGGTIRLLDVETGTCMRTLGDNSSGVYSIVYSRQRDMIVSISYNGSVLLWDVESGTARHLLTLSGYPYPSLDISPQGHLIASGGYDVKLWDAVTGDCKAILIGHTRPIYSVIFSPSGKLVASRSGDWTVRLWDVESLTCQHILNCQTDVSDIAFPPQGHQIATASYDGRVQLWDVETGDCLMILIGHTDVVKAVVFSLNGNTLISGSGYTDSLVCLWDVTSGHRRAVIRNIPCSFREITRGVASEDVYVVTNLNGSTIVWKIIDEGDRCRVILPWVNATGELKVTGASVQGVRGLSQVNKKLLKQRGAEGEPESQLLEASKKVVAMASVMSKLRQSKGRATLDTANVVPPGEQTELRDEQVRDS